MESLLTQGILHVHGTLLWIAAITITSLELVRTFRKERREDLGSRWRLPLFFTFLITTIFTGSTGLFFLYEWEIWNSLMKVDFWWVHSMILVWFLFNIVFFILDPLLLKRPE